MVGGQEHAASAPSGGAKPRRQRASPARLVKLYKDLNETQRRKIRSIGFGGLLKIGSQTLPAAFADWVMGVGSLGHQAPK